MITTYTFRQFFQGNITAGTSGLVLPATANRPMIQTTSKLYGKNFDVLTARTIISASLSFDSLPSELYRVGFIVSPISDGAALRRLVQAQMLYTVGALVDLDTAEFCLQDEVLCSALQTSQYSGSVVAAASKTNDFGLLQPVFSVAGGQNLYNWVYYENGSNSAGVAGSYKIVTSVALTVEVKK